MKLINKNKTINYSVSALGFLLALSCTETQAGAMGPVQAPSSKSVYFGVFGGGGASNNVDLNLYGVAFFPETVAPFLGPLDVNVFGQTDSRSVGMIGGQIGYIWNDVSLNSLNISATLSPAIELEGYYLGKSSFNGRETSNESFLLPEHNFVTTYPISTGVVLGNMVLNFNPSIYSRWHPYVGGGLGAAILSISNANSLQVLPLEANINHFNGNPNDTVATFAAQIKAGLNFAITQHFSVFGEYRGLYIANTSFTFGSTIYPPAIHVPTSSWNSHFGAQYYNIGSAGIRFTV